MKEASGYNTKLKPHAQKLRSGMTPEERHLWYNFLKDYPLQFKRQRPSGVYRRLLLPAGAAGHRAGWQPALHRRRKSL